MEREEHRHCLISDNEKLPSLNLSKTDTRGINQTTETNKTGLPRWELEQVSFGHSPRALVSAATPALVCFNSSLPLTLF